LEEKKRRTRKGERERREREERERREEKRERREERERSFVFVFCFLRLGRSGANMFGAASSCS